MLAKKFASLYYLLEDLLSPQKHYDWGLRAIKSVLVVAGSLLRAEAGQVESDVLFRALRDFNIPKILAEVRVCVLGMQHVHTARPQTILRHAAMYLPMLPVPWHGLTECSDDLTCTPCRT